jgi:hypothetical protein
MFRYCTRFLFNIQDGDLFVGKQVNVDGIAAQTLAGHPGDLSSIGFLVSASRSASPSSPLLLPLALRMTGLALNVRIHHRALSMRNYPTCADAAFAVYDTMDYSRTIMLIGICRIINSIKKGDS